MMIQFSLISFGIYKQTKISDSGYRKVVRDIGIVNNKKIDIYNAYEDGTLVHKLYYLSDLVGNWIKSKLKYITNGKVSKTVRSENKKGKESWTKV